MKALNGWIVGLLILLVSPVAQAWEHQDTESGVAVYTKDTPGSDIDTVKGVVTIPYATDDVHRVLENVSRYKRFMKDLKRARLLKQQDMRDGRVIGWIYQRLEFSALDDRDLVIRAVTTKAETPRGNQYLVKFKAVTNFGPKPLPNVIRITTLTGTWKLKPIQGGKKTRVTYIRHIEMGGSVPDFLVNSGVKESMMFTLKALRKECRRAAK